MTDQILAACLAPSWGNWFPNIVCTLVGLLLGWLLGRRQSKVSQRIQANLLHIAARQDGQTPYLDKHGNPTGQLDRRIEVPTAGDPKP